MGAVQLATPVHFWLLPAKFEEDFLEHEHRPCAAQDGERLSGEQGVSHACQRGPKQRLNGTLQGREKRGTGWV